jgi:hypothetical protein
VLPKNQNIPHKTNSAKGDHQLNETEVSIQRHALSVIPELSM